MSDNLKDKPASLELIIYQIGQLDKNVGVLSTQLASNIAKMDDRVKQLELWRASLAEQKEEAKQPLDVQKIVLAAFALVSTALTIIASMAAGWIK